MQETIAEKNILSWLAGFYDAEGCVRINKSVRRGNNITYRPVINLVNTDLGVMDFCKTLLDYYGINSYVSLSRPTTNRKPRKDIEVNRLSKVIELVDLISPYSQNKYEELLLLKSFCESRLERITASSKKNRQVPYNDFETSMYDKLIEYKSHKKGRKCTEYKPIYTNCPNDMTWQWFAGYIDGDGSFSINKAGSLSFCVATTNPVVNTKLTLFLKENDIDFLNYSELPSKNHLNNCKRRVYKTFVNKNEEIEKVINGVEKYTLCKSDIIKMAKVYIGLRKHRKGKCRTEYEKSFYQRMRKLTQ